MKSRRCTLSALFIALLSLVGLSASVESAARWPFSTQSRPPSRQDSTASNSSERIAFVSERDGNSEIYLMDANGNGLTNLTNNPANDHSPTWSPDGQQIAFVSNRNGVSAASTINARVKRGFGTWTADALK